MDPTEVQGPVEKPKKSQRPLSEARKIRKPLMERKRRERINASLNELANLLQQAKKVKAEAGKANKLEKADILELTVSHLQNLQNVKRRVPAETPTADEDKYYEGFRECLKVVERILRQSTTDALREKLLSYLHSRLKCLKALKATSCGGKENQPPSGGLWKRPGEKRKAGLHQQSETTKQNCSFTLVPTELADGGVAFVLKGDTKKLLQEWRYLSGEASSEKWLGLPTAPVALSADKKANISCDDELMLSDMMVPTHSSSRSVDDNLRSKIPNEDLNSSRGLSNQSAESENNILDISGNIPSFGAQSTSTDSTELGNNETLSDSTMPSEIPMEYLCTGLQASSLVYPESPNRLSPNSSSTTLCLTNTHYSAHNKETVTCSTAENSSGLIPSGSHAAIKHSDQHQNSSSAKEDLAGRDAAVSSQHTSVSSQRRLPNKTHCPPTPPPSPPSGAEYRNSSKAAVNEPENGRLSGGQLDIDQPFDLRVNKMWRPW